MKTGKELKLDLHKNYKVTIGTVNNKDPKSIYILISAWGQVINKDIDNYTNIINALDKSIRQKIYKIISTADFSKDHTIVDLDMRKSGITYDKRSFMKCDITLFQTNNHPINDIIMNDKLTRITNTLIEDIFEKNDYFKFSKTKTLLKGRGISK